MSGTDRGDGVAVDLGGDGDGAVSEGVGNVFDRHSGRGEQAGGGVAEHVRMHVGELGLRCEASVDAVDVGGGQGCADVGGEHQVVGVLPGPTGRVLVGFLAGALGFEGVDDRGGSPTSADS